MRKLTTALLLAGCLAIAACGGGSDPADTGATGDSSGSSPVTIPVTAPVPSSPVGAARDAVSQQNQQLQQMEQRAASDDPTAP